MSNARQPTATLATDPLFTVIVPAYNRAHCLGLTLDSVLAQTVPDWECIVVENEAAGP